MALNFRSRNPYPARIWHDAGNAFSMGLVGGSVWHFVKAVRNAPKVPGQRLARPKYAMQVFGPRAIRVAGNFGTWGGLFACSEFLVHFIRRKEDGWNVIASGFIVASTLQLRFGWKRALMSGVFGGLFMSIFEGVGKLLNHQNEAAMQAQYGEHHVGVSTHNPRTRHM